MWQELENFCTFNQLSFRQPRLLERAFTHSTYAYEQGVLRMDNERLEFLGDAVLQLAVSELLFNLQDQLPEGRMTKLRSLLVCENTLAQIAQKLGIGQALRLGRGEEKTGGREKPSNLADACEALFAAIYLDQGFAVACPFVQEQIRPYLAPALAGHLVYDFKSRLLEYGQANKTEGQLQFRIISESGPVHDRDFIAALYRNDEEISQGNGKTKKEAEQMAARRALTLWGVLPEELSCT